MAERCPLLNPDKEIRAGFPIDVPEICLIQCGDLMDEANTAQTGEWDDYLKGETVPAGEVGFSHDAIALDSLRNKSARQYRVVDRVDTPQGWIEIGETSYTFNCPRS
jgi:hypothetical protein